MPVLNFQIFPRNETEQAQQEQDLLKPDNLAKFDIHQPESEFKAHKDHPLEVYWRFSPQSH